VPWGLGKAKASQNEKSGHKARSFLNRPVWED
jgi:hypothetical protein